MGLLKKARRRLQLLERHGGQNLASRPAAMKFLEKRLEENLASRPCDGCTACCTGVFGIPELNLTMGESCPHVRAGGCGIYPDRPTPCQEFLCAWRTGVGDIEDRPDKTGIVLDHARRHPLEGKALVAREVWPGAFEAAMPMLYRIAQSVLVFLVSGDKPRRILGPEDKLYAAREIIAKMVADARGGVGA